MHGGMEVQYHAFLNLTQDGCEWPAARHGCFTPTGRALDTLWIGGWVGPSARLDPVVKRKQSLLLLGIKYQ